MDNTLKGILATLLCSAGFFFLAPLFAVSSPETSADTVIASDRITQPPLQQTVENGGYRLEIAAKDNWQTPSAIARLTKDSSLLWEQELPHQYGPRFFLVSTSGQVVLFDEYINVASDYAIALFDVQGNLTAQHSFDDIHKALPRLTRADFTRQASSGWWISASPTLNQDENSAQVETGGTTLQINLNTGTLTERRTL